MIRQLKGRSRGFLTILTAVALLAVVAATASATTSPTNYRIFKVRLTDHGVSFSPSARLEVGEVGLFKITNVSRSARVFTVSTRSTHLLKGKKTEAFYEIFPTLGKVRWTSHAVRGKSFAGFLRVVPCKDSSGTSLCNGTGG